MRKAAIVLAVILLVFVVLILLIPRLVSVDSLKPRVVAALEEKTGRKIGLSGLSLSLFPGIGVKVAGLTVSGDARHPGERLLSVPEAEIRLAIAPLFSGKAEFTKIILHRPEIRFRKYRDGTHSVTDIVNRIAGEEKSAAGPPARKKEEGVTLVLGEVNVEEAKLFLRLEEKDGAETRWEISPFTVRLSGIGDRRNDFEVRTRIEGLVRGEVSFSGHLSRVEGAGTARAATAILGKGVLFGQKVAVAGEIYAVAEPPAVDLAISFPGIEMDKIAEILKDPPDRLARARLAGVIPLSVKVTGGLSAPAFEARADLTRAGGTLNADPELRKYVGTPCTIAAKGRYAAGRLHLSSAELFLSPLSVTASAVLHTGTGAREWAASAKISSLAELGTIRGAGPLSKWSPEGMLTATGKGRREKSAAKETYEGEIDLGEVGLRVPDRGIDLRKLTGKIALTSGSVEFSRLAGLLNGRRFSLDGNASLGPAAAGMADLRMAYLDVDALYPPQGERDKKEEKNALPGQAAKEERGKRAVSARIRLAIDAGKARGVEFTDLRGLVRYEKGNLHLDSVTARMYGGEVAISGFVGLASPAPDFQVKVALKDLAAEEILSRKTSLKDFLSGPVSLSADLSGGMKDFADFTRTATGSGSIKITGGKIKGLDLLSTVAGLAGLPSLVPGATATRGDAAKGETPFSDLSASFRIEGGKIRSESLRIVSEKLGLAGKIAVGFDRTLDFRGMVRLSREMSERVRGKAGTFLVGESGEVEIPLVMSGPLSSPAVTIDTAALAKGAGERLLRGLTEKILERSGSSAADNAAKEAPAKTPERQDTMREVEGLFRKFLPGTQR
ncbi:MAG: AsmA family protein [Candidatus Deferrimicrobiaceae bacterium]